MFAGSGGGDHAGQLRGPARGALHEVLLLHGDSHQRTGQLTL